jgi:hypothetical protein
VVLLGALAMVGTEAHRRDAFTALVEAAVCRLGEPALGRALLAAMAAEGLEGTHRTRVAALALEVAAGDWDAAVEAAVAIRVVGESVALDPGAMPLRALAAVGQSELSRPLEVGLRGGSGRRWRVRETEKERESR